MSHIIRSVGVEEGVDCRPAYMCLRERGGHAQMPAGPVEHLAGAALKSLAQIFLQLRGPQPEHRMHAFI